MEKCNGIKKACALLGGQVGLAKKLNIASPSVNEWINGGRGVPPLRCVEIEQLTEGAVTRKELRPDDWWKWWPELSV